MKEPGTHQARSRRRQLLWLALGLLVLLEVLWIAGANWALSSAWITERINRRPDKLEVLWSRASTWLPGVVWVHDLSVRGQGRHQQWYVQLERARVHLSLLALPFRTFKTYDVRASQLDFRFRKRVTPSAEPSLEQDWPTIPGLEIDAPPPEPRPPRGKRPWIIDLGGVHVESLEQIWLFDYRLRGDGTIDANVRIEIHGQLEVERGRVDLRDAELSAHDESLGSELALRIDASLLPFDPGEVSGLEVLRFFSGSLSATGTAMAQHIVNAFLDHHQAFVLDGPPADLDLAVRFDHGTLLEGSRFEIAQPDAVLDLFDWRARGPAEIGFEVTASEGGPRSELAIELESVAVSNDRRSEPLLAGAKLEVVARGGQPRIERDLTDLTRSVESVTLELVNATAADVSALPIPRLGDFRLVSGTVTLGAHAELTLDRSDAKVEVRGSSIEATYGSLQLNGNVDIDARLSAGDVRDRRFAFSDSSVAIRDVSVSDGKRTERGWYLELDITDGELLLQRPGATEFRARLVMKDSRPIVALFGQQKQIIRHLRGLLDFEDLEGTARVGLTRDVVQLDEVELAGQGLEVKSRLRIEGGKPRGLLYARVHGIPVGIDMSTGESRLVLRRPLRWYQSQDGPWQDLYNGHHGRGGRDEPGGAP